METNEKTRNSKILNIVILLIIIIVIIGIIGIAYAKYITSEKGTAEAQVAKWSFKVVDGDTSTIDVLDFPITRTDDNMDVNRSTIGPGTYGKFEIDIDARGTETIVSYGIRIGFTNKPDNLKFYSDEDMSNEIELDGDGNLIVSGFLSLEDVRYIQPHMIYWNWPFQTGTTLEEIAGNDEKDSAYIGKKLQMAITVTGVQGEEYLVAGNSLVQLTVNNETSEFMSLQDAINAAGNNQNAEIKILRGMTVGGATIGANQDITLNLNGKTLTLNNSLTNNGNLIITGAGKITSIGISTIKNQGRFVKKGSSVIDNISTNGAVRTIVNSGDITIKEGRVTRSQSNVEENTSYYVINNSNKGKLTIEGRYNRRNS